MSTINAVTEQAFLNAVFDGTLTGMYIIEPDLDAVEMYFADYPGGGLYEFNTVFEGAVDETFRVFTDEVEKMFGILKADVETYYNSSDAHTHGFSIEVYGLDVDGEYTGHEGDEPFMQYHLHPTI